MSVGAFIHVLIRAPPSRRFYRSALKETLASESPTHVTDICIKHKFSTPIMCNVDISNGRGTGTHHFFILTVYRDDPEPMIVTDVKGKLLHISRDVANDLGYAVIDLLGELAEKAWKVLLPEPFNNLHSVHIKSELSPTIPPFSCRSGLSVCFLASTDEGYKPKPYKIKVKTRRSVEGTMHVLSSVRNGGTTLLSPKTPFA